MDTNFTAISFAITRDLQKHAQYITKAELLKEGIFFLIHLFVRDILVIKKLEIEKTKPTFIISVLKGGLSFFDFQLL